MSHYTNFRPFHQYNSYYPYYLPSYYSRFYPNHYDRFFEPTEYWLEKRQPIIEVQKNQNHNHNQNHNFSKQSSYWGHAIMMTIILFVVLYLILLK